MARTPVVLLTCGDPAGIGPELALAARAALGADLPFVWIGDPRHLQSKAYAEVKSPSAAHDVAPDLLPVLHHPFPATARPGLPDAANAASIVEVIARAVRMVQAGDAAALCTLPINKKALQDGAQFPYPGHTEYLAALAGAGHSVMMLASDTLRVVPVTIHIPLETVKSALTPALLEDTIRITARDLTARFGIPQPRIAVAGLNPHAGEGGKMGREEIEIITPVLDRLRSEGMALSGPHSADTMFHAAARAHYDVAIAMYHDQALIPIKTLDFDRGVNVTLGLPFIRTSPDHGTAYDIAGTGRANPTSTIEALKLAHRLSGSAHGH